MARDLKDFVRSQKTRAHYSVASGISEAGADARPGRRQRAFRQSGCRLPAPLLAAAFALEKTGDVALTGRTDGGLFVLRLTEKRPAGPATFEEVEEEIKMRLGQKTRAERVDAWIGEMKARTKIEVFEDRLRALASPRHQP